MMRILPNRLNAPLTRDEQLAEHYMESPGRLIELAQATGNKALMAVALALKAELPRKKRRERRWGQGT